MGDSGARNAASGCPAAEPRTSWVDATVGRLYADGLILSPHVVAQLHARLGESHTAILEVAASLTPAQRNGHRALPRPLPLVASVMAVGEDLELTPREREALVTVVLSTQRRADFVLPLVELTAEDLSHGALERSLVIDAGRVEVRDRLLAAWVEATVTPAESAAVHQRLRDQHAREGDIARAAWHSACSATQQDATIAAALLPVARRLAHDGQSAAAFHVAVEAFHHAAGADADEARLVAGEAALCAGMIADAVDWLGSLFPSGAVGACERALAPLVIAETTLRGAVPIIDPSSHRPRTGDPDSWRSWARAAGMAAVMSAERGADGAMRMWLAELRDADLKAGAEGTIRGPAVALCWLLSGDRADAESGDETLTYAVADALEAAMSGDIDAGLEILARHESTVSGRADPFLDGFERTPLAAAYRSVTEALLRFWVGDLETARQRLADAHARHPVALPFAGLAVVLARRLDLAVLGEISPVTRAVSRSLPTGIRVDAAVDRAIEAYLRGSVEEASARMQLWHDRGAPAPVLAISGLEEVGPEPISDLIEPPDQTIAAGLSRTMRTTAQSAWQREYPGIAERARAVRSPFIRGRLEALLGTTCVIRGDRAAGRRHLLVARSLLEDAGAAAWCDDVDRRLARLGEQIEQLAGLETAPIPLTSVLDPLAACRAAWTPLLTDRELQVAMLVVEGISNRELADRLQVSVRTIEVHLGRVFAKLDVRSRVELTVLAHRTNQHI